MVSTLTTPAKKRGRKPATKTAQAANVGTRTIESTQSTPQPVAKRTKKNPVSEREWRRYRKMQSHEMRQELLNKYLPLVRNVASRMAMGFPRSVELPDLINTGVIGLVEAFGNFDPSRGVKFETYAVPRIRGAILDELRALDWVPRSTRAKSREIERAFLELENQLGRPPEKTELARYLKVSVQELHLSLEDVSGTNILSLDEVIFREDDNRQVPRVETIMDTGKINILGEIEKDELRAFLVIAMDKLTGQEKLVIALYYYEELTLKEIGEVMSISESRVSQIHTRAVSKLRTMVQEKFALTG